MDRRASANANQDKLLKMLLLAAAILAPKGGFRLRDCLASQHKPLIIQKPTLYEGLNFSIPTASPHCRP